MLAAFGLAQPASAAAQAWEPVTADSTFHCAQTLTTDVPNMIFQVCTVMSGSYGQLVLIATNNSGNSVAITGSVRTTINNAPTNYADCGDSHVGYPLPAHTRRGCFGKTLFLNCNQTIGGEVSLALMDLGGTDYPETAVDRSHC